MPCIREAPSSSRPVSPNASFVGIAHRRLQRAKPADRLRRAQDQRALVRIYQTDPASRSAVVGALMPLALHVARRMPLGPQAREEVEQVASIGLVAALSRFDLARDSSFAAFAIPTIYGEITHHFRDTGWALSVPSRVKELAIRVQRVDRSGTAKSTDAIASALGVAPREVTQARAALEAMHADGDRMTQDEAARWAAENALLRAERRADISRLTAGLDRQERTVLALSFAADKSQREIARTLGVTQIRVSRLRRRALAHMLDEATA